MMAIKTPLLLLAAALLLGGCNDSGGGNTQHAATDGRWNIVYSPTMPGELSQPGDYFDFTTDTSGVDYVIRSWGLVRAGQTMIVHFRVSGAGVLLPTEGAPPPKLRLFMQRKGDDLTGQGPAEFFRWWSRDFIDLSAPGDYQLSVVVQPDQWSSVFGKGGEVAPDGFADCIANLEHVGFTFGGNFAGHGVYDSTGGGVRFEALGFAVTD